MFKVRYLKIMVLVATMLAISLAGAETDKEKEKRLRERSPQQVISDMVTGVRAIFGHEDYKKTENQPKLREKIRLLVLHDVDMEYVGYLTLGMHRGKFSTEEFKEFTDAFSKMLLTSYVSQMESTITDEYSVTDTETVKVPEGSPAKARVKSKSVSGSRETAIIYSMLQKKDGAWKVYDVNVEGVSLVKNYRTDFNSIMRRSKPKDLIKKIADKIEENAKK